MKNKGKIRRTSILLPFYTRFSLGLLFSLRFSIYPWVFVIFALCQFAIIWGFPMIGSDVLGLLNTRDLYDILFCILK